MFSFLRCILAVIIVAVAAVGTNLSAMFNNVSSHLK